jgi:hypothetical protein
LAGYLPSTARSTSGVDAEGDFSYGPGTSGGRAGCGRI